MASVDKHKYPSVHCGITRAAAHILELEQHPAAEFFTAGAVETMVQEAAEPDRIGDRQQGRGRHYYCAVTPECAQRPINEAAGCYCSGTGHTAPSALTMLEAEYRAALMLERAGNHTAALKSLSRAVHMLSDICCPPHTAGLTYFSRYAMTHKRYEGQAAELFWTGEFGGTDPVTAAEQWAERAAGQIPYDDYHDLTAEPAGDTPMRHASRFAVICNEIAASSASELPAVLGMDDSIRADSIRRRVTLSIANSAAMLAAFVRDLNDSGIKVLEERYEYRLWSIYGKTDAVKEPVLFEFAEDGSVQILTQERNYLSVSRFGKVQFTGADQGKTHFRIGSEPYPVLYPEGDQSSLLIYAGGQLRCISRKLLRLAPAQMMLQSGFRFIRI